MLLYLSYKSLLLYLDQLRDRFDMAVHKWPDNFSVSNEENGGNDSKYANLWNV